MKDNLEMDRLLSLGINFENTLEDNVSEFRTNHRKKYNTELEKGQLAYDRPSQDIGKDVAYEKAKQLRSETVYNVFSIGRAS